MVLDAILDPILGWTLTMPLWLGIFILSLILTLLINIVYKFTTNQKEMKELKDKIKEYQKEMRKVADDKKKLTKIQARAMEANKKYMISSLKPTLYTLIPLLIIFAWMNANLAFAVLEPGTTIDVSAQLDNPARVTLESQGLLIEDGTDPVTKETIESQVTFRVAADKEGAYVLMFTTEEGAKAEHTLLVGEMATDPLKVQDAPFKRTQINYQKAKPFGDFSLFGYEPGWLFTYIVFSVLLSIVSRRVMNIY